MPPECLRDPRPEAPYYDGDPPRSRVETLGIVESENIELRALYQAEAADTAACRDGLRPQLGGGE